LDVCRGDRGVNGYHHYVVYISAAPIIKEFDFVTRKESSWDNYEMSILFTKLNKDVALFVLI